MIDKYILDEKGNAVPEPDLMKWGKWLQTAKRHVGLTKLPKKFGRSVSTVFLGLDHSFSFEAQVEPVLWETMIFGGPQDQYQDRYTSKEEALEGHKTAVKLALVVWNFEQYRKTKNRWRRPVFACYGGR